MYKFLKNTRVVLSIIFLVVISLSFVYLSKDGTSLFAGFLKFQFVPSVLGLLTGSFIAFLVLFILTLLFGRIYCSVLCPVGVLQDVVTKIACRFKTKKNRRFNYDKPKNILRYIVLAIVGLPFIFGITLPLVFLDPYSNYGRIANQLFRKGEILLNNQLANFFPETLYHKVFTGFVLGSFLFSVVFLLVVVVMSSLRGRLYCNTICHVGTILGMISRISLFKPIINKEKCTTCRMCEFKCKSQCIDLATKEIDHSRCVTCFNCVDTCKFGAVKYRLSFGSSKSSESSDNKEPKRGRREAMIAMGLIGTALATRAFDKFQFGQAKPKIVGIAPPGAKSIAHLKKHCTSCHACIAACPNGIIKPAVVEYGIDGIMLPVLNFKDHFCGYECNLCSQVCPNGALLPLTKEEKQLTQIGKVEFTLEKCIVHTDGTDCGACDEHCPTKAITMVPYGDTSLFIPSVNQSICIGCGGCEYICPSKEKAMIVHANEIHAIAQKPTKEEQKKVKVDEFGF